MFYIKDSDGKPSLSATLVIISFGATLLSYVLSIVERIGTVPIRPFDIGACSAFFIPVLTLYFGRKYTAADVTKAMISAPEPGGTPQPPAGKPLP